MFKHLLMILYNALYLQIWDRIMGLEKANTPDDSKRIESVLYISSEM